MEYLVSEHKSDIQAWAGWHDQLALTDSQHPVEAEREVKLTGRAVVEAYVRRDVEEALLVDECLFLG